jgi:hypothetical protein
MGTTVTLDKRHFKAAAEKAKALGQTPQTFIETLIDAATSSFDEVLSTVRRAFAKSGVTEDELDDAVCIARKAIRSRSRSRRNSSK